MNLPTKLTFLRILLIPVFVAVFFIPFDGYRIVAVAVFAAACLTDFLDGYLARRLNQVTTLGKFLDPIADKLLVACALIAVGTDTAINMDNAELFQSLIIIFSMIIICREILVSGFRIVAASKNITLAADVWGKIKTIFQMFALLVLIPYKSLIDMFDPKYVYIIGFVLLAAATILTILSGANYLIKNKKVLKDAKGE